MQKSGNGLSLPGVMSQNRMMIGPHPLITPQLGILHPLHAHTNFASKNGNGLMHEDLKVESSPICKFLIEQLRICCVSLLRPNRSFPDVFFLAQNDSDRIPDRCVSKLLVWLLDL